MAAEVQISGTERRFNWRIFPFPIWDFPVGAETATDNQGRFSARLKVTDETATLHARKDGYLAAEQVDTAGTNIVIGRLKKTTAHKPAEFTTRCKLSSECLVTTTETDAQGRAIQVTKNVCQ